MSEGRADGEESDDPPGWRARAAAAPVSAALAGICLALFAATLVAVGLHAERPWVDLGRALWTIESDAGLVQLGALELTRVWIDHEWWRLATAIFLHGSWIHLLLNLSALVSVGEWLERGIGSLRTLAIFAVAGLGGSLASLAWCEAPVVVGASAGILGMAGALWIARISAPKPIRARIQEVSAGTLAVMIALCVGLGVVVPLIAQAGHLGGLLTGSLALLVVLGPALQRLLSAAALIALFALLVTAGAQPSARSNYHLFMGYRYLQDERPDEALAAFDAALERRPGDPELGNAVAYHLALAERDLDRAATLVDSALEADPTNADYLDTQGWIACLQGDVTRGEQLLRRALAASERGIPEIDEHLVECEAAATRALARVQ